MKKQIVGCFVLGLLGCNGVLPSEPTKGQAQAVTSATNEIAWLKVLDVARGYDSTCAVTELEELRCFGSNRSGSIGLPVSEKSLATPTNNVSTGNYGEFFTTASAPNREHACAVTSQGGVICWGRGDRGQLGAGSFFSTPQKPLYNIGLPAPATQVINLFQASCALTLDGDAYCWGANNTGLLGYPAGPQEQSTIAKQVGTSKYIRLAGLGFTACGITAPTLENGGVSGVECWGDNRFGQTGLVDGQSSVHVPRAVPNVSHVTDLSGDMASFCAVTEAGIAVCWGLNPQGVRTGDSSNFLLTLPPTEIALPESDILMRKISVGSDLACAITTTDHVYCWGNATAMQDNTPNEFKMVGPSLMFAPTNTQGEQLPLQASTISTNYGSTCAVTLDKELVCWGIETEGRLGNGVTANSNNRTPFYVQFGFVP